MFAIEYFGSTKDSWVGSHVIMFYNNVSYLETIIVLVTFQVWVQFFEIFYNYFLIKFGAFFMSILKNQILFSVWVDNEFNNLKMILSSFENIFQDEAWNFSYLHNKIILLLSETE